MMSYPQDRNEAFERIRQDLAAYDVVLYMKGTPAFPQCGFSAAMVQMLDNLKVQYKDFDVMTDNSLRQSLKDFANWPSTPQLYIKGEFIGGCDVVRELYNSGELKEILKQKSLLK